MTPVKLHTVSHKLHEEICCVRDNMSSLQFLVSEIVGHEDRLHSTSRFRPLNLNVQQ